jgi:hypothetical protein
MKTIARIVLWAAVGGIAICSLAAEAERHPDRGEDARWEGGVVKSLNGLAGRVTLTAGSNITLVSLGNGITISAAGAAPGGVRTLNGLTGDVLLTPGTNVTFSTSGNRIQVNAPSVGGADPNAWHRAGDDALPGQFLGTLNDEPLEVKVNGQRALRLEPNTNGAPNVIGGCSVNFVATDIFGATIAGGGVERYPYPWSPALPNSIASRFGSIGGGINNKIQEDASGSTIGGGGFNAVRSRAYSSTISGGDFNEVQADATESTIGGGYNNRIQGPSMYCNIAGGAANTIQDETRFTTIGGGFYNAILTGNTGSTISGGYNSTMQTNAWYSTIGGGYHNSVSGSYGIVAGGDENTANTNSFAAGHRAKADHQGAFVWADSTDADAASTADNQFVARASGGVVFYSNPDLTSGVFLPPGGGSWSMLSDRNIKENVQPVDGRGVLDQLCAVPLATWNYKTQDKSIRHMGPMAQDFHAAFQVGEDDKHIATLDEGGVALAAIQGLNQKVEEQRAENAELKQEVAELKKLISGLIQKLSGGAR